MQPRVGIGDMIWHLPHIRALARHTGQHVTLVTRQRSLADQLVGTDDDIDDVFWIERGQWTPEGRHQGMAGFAKLILDLRARRFDAAVFLTRSRNLALAAAAAGIPRRYGYGIGLQRFMLNRRPYLSDADLRRHPFDQAGAWLAAAGVALAQAEPRLAVTDAARAAVRARLGPGMGVGQFVALGIASSDTWKNWGAPSFADLASRLIAGGCPGLVLLGGAAEQADAADILATLTAANAAKVVPVLGWNLREVAALLQDAAYYVGNDTAVLNIAAAVGTRAYGLFGGTPVLRHSANILPIVPEGGPDRDTGMARISVGMVLETIAAAS